MTPAGQTLDEGAKIVIPTNLTFDVMVLATTLPLAVFTLGLCLYILIFPDAAPAAEGVRPFVSDVAASTLPLAAATIWLCARGFGALRRAVDRRPMLVADTNGLTFHPALGPTFVAWRDIRRIHVTGWRSPYNLAFDLKPRIWAVEAPLTTRRVRIGAIYLDDAMGRVGFVSPALISRLEALRAEAGAAGITAYRDPGAAG